MSKIKPHILKRDKERFERFLGWASPYVPYTPVHKIRKAFLTYKLQNRWIEFMYHLVGDTLGGKHIDRMVLVQGVLTGEIYRRCYEGQEGNNFDIILRKVHFDGKPVIDKLSFNSTNRLYFSSRIIYDCRPKG